MTALGRKTSTDAAFGPWQATKQGKDLELSIRAVRGATTVTEDDRDAILAATTEMLTEVMQRNGFTQEQLVSVFFTMTQDLTAVAPALAARQLGWMEPALLCVQELAVANSLPMTIRVLAHVETEVPRAAIQNVYLRGTEVLRADPAS